MSRWQAEPAEPEACATLLVPAVLCVRRERTLIFPALFLLSSASIAIHFLSAPALAAARLAEALAGARKTSQQRADQNNQHIFTLLVVGTKHGIYGKDQVKMD